MKSKTQLYLMTGLVAIVVNCPASYADNDNHGHGHGYGHGDDHGNGHGNDHDNGHGNDHGNGHGNDRDHDHDNDHDRDRHDASYNGNSRNWKKYQWNDERSLYKKHWKKISAAQQAQYDAEMRTQWMAYHHNNWKGTPTWNNYNDPAFLDYLHNTRPTLLDNLRGVIGF
ncbi:MAG: hypothetical protein K2X81_06240 [Candidatus Obscuribacterales bacterium]|nr:hypothetical protein [Candidatus Obscuribacterales bacterium]